MDMDLIITGGTVIDGTGTPGFVADVGIREGIIREIGVLRGRRAGRTIDAQGLVVAPGFIDIHTHDDALFFVDPLDTQKLQQGVSTVVTGNCGISYAPVNPSRVDHLRANTAVFGIPVDFGWRGFGEYLEEISRLRTAVNVVPLVGHGALRIASMGLDNRAPSSEEMDDMIGLLAECMEAGAWGMSTGLIYPPGTFSTTAELIALAGVVRMYGGVYASHIRDEGDQVEQALHEAIRIGREAGVRVQISHLKVANRWNWGNSEKLLSIIEDARSSGLDIAADAYPYTAGSTYLSSLFPAWVSEGGEAALRGRLTNSETRKEIVRYIEERRDWDNLIKGLTGWHDIVLTSVPNDRGLEGRNIWEISRGTGKDPYDTLFDIALSEGFRASIVIFRMSEQDVSRIVCDPAVSIVTDDFPPDTGRGKPHPRAYGSFPRVLGWYVREKGLMSLEQAVRKMTALPASRLNLETKGVLRTGYDADITIFDPATIRDLATYEEPRRVSEGIEYVIVNGRVVLDGGGITGETPGRVCRHIGRCHCGDAG